jgi:S-formylglutathione hydrolase FrmB
MSKLGRSLASALVIASIVFPARAGSTEGTVERQIFRSDVIGKPVQVDVFLPPGYSARGPLKPVLYLLHGAIAEAAYNFPLAVERIRADLGAAGIVGVMPISGSPWQDPLETPEHEVVWEAPAAKGLPDPTGYVSDGVNRGRASYETPRITTGPRYETHFLSELMPFIEAHYRVRRDRNGRGLIGHSGGAYGASMLALRHPDVFSFVGASSGPVSVRNPYWIGTIGIPVGFLLGSRDPVTDEIYYRAIDPKERAENFLGAGFTLMVSSGDGTCPSGTLADNPACNPTDIFLETIARPINDDYTARLTELGVRHTYLKYPGTHDVELIADAAWHTFVSAARSHFVAPPTNPPMWRYKTTDRDFGLWGYRFHVDRFNTEFLELQNVRSAGFSVTGTGAFTVRTPRLYRPGEAYRIVTAGPEGSSAQTILADRSGRLSFVARLASSRVADQDSKLEAAGLFPFSTYTVSITPGRSQPTQDPTECAPVWASPVVPC